MKRYLMIALNILIWVGAIGLCSMLALLSEFKSKPLAVIVYFIVFAAIFGAMFLAVKNGQKKSLATGKPNILIPKIVGIVLTVAGLVLPSIIFGRLEVPNLKYNVFIGFPLTLVLAVIGAFAIRMINHADSKKSLASIGGYLILIVVSAIPGLLISRFDSSSDTLGLVYFSAIFVSVLCWWGISLFQGHQHEI